MLKWTTGLVCVLLVSLVVAQTDLPDPGMTPDSPFYGFKRFSEGVGLFFTFDDVAKAEKHLHFAELRLSEAREMTERGKPEFVPDLTEDYENDLDKSQEIATVAKGLGKNVTKVEELVALATSIHIEVLEGVLEKVPDVAKPAIEEALDASSRGQEQALNSLGQERPEKSAELCFRFAEKRLNRARERIREDDAEEAEEMVGEYRKMMNKSLEMQERARNAGKDVTDVSELVSEATSEHLEVLQEVYEKVPEESKSAIESAMEVSVRGHEESVRQLKEAGSMSESAEETPETPEGMSEDIANRIGSRK